MPDVELGVNDLWRQGKEVVGRHDIIPVITEEWIRLENVEFHSCVQQDEYERTRVIKWVTLWDCNQYLYKDMHSMILFLNHLQFHVRR